MNTDTNRNGDVPVYSVDLDETTDQSTTYTVVTTVADLTGRTPDDLAPLWDSVDPEALDSFVAHASESSTPYRVAFEYEGYTVEIVENRQLRFTPSEKSLSAVRA